MILTRFRRLLPLVRLILPWLTAIFLTPALAEQQATPAPVSSPKVYNPFDEPRPKIPQEMVGDKQLDTKVKVFAKSKNMKQLFDELTGKTGVKITVSRKLWGERPIVFFHERPVRDVLTEISGLYGYRWLVTGKPGAYEYELFEDIRHAKRHEEVKEQREAELNALFVSLTEKAIKNPKLIDELYADDEYTPALGPEYLNGFPAVLSGLSDGDPRRLLSMRAGDYAFGELSPKVQTALMEWTNKFTEADCADRERRGRPRTPKVFALGDLASIQLSVVVIQGDGGDLPGLFIAVEGQELPVSYAGWPPLGTEEDDARKVLRMPARPMVSTPQSLPEKASITANEERQPGYVTLGDVLQAIAEQAKLDVVADYYLQDYCCIDPFEKQDLRKTLDMITEYLDYSIQFDGSVLRLRDYTWFAREHTPVPPAALVERCWKELGDPGWLSLRSLQGIASLPEDQMAWLGFQFIPGADDAQCNVEALQFVSALGPDQIASAETEAGVAVSGLTPAQMDKFIAWTESDFDPVKPELLAQAAFRMKYVDDPNSDGYRRYYSMDLLLPDQEPLDHQIPLESMFDPNELKQVVEQRKADAEADVVEVLE